MLPVTARCLYFTYLPHHPKLQVLPSRNLKVEKQLQVHPEKFTGVCCLPIDTNTNFDTFPMFKLSLKCSLQKQIGKTQKALGYELLHVGRLSCLRELGSYTR